MATVKPRNCIDCGKSFQPRTNVGQASGRCPECQHQYRCGVLRVYNKKRNELKRAGLLQPDPNWKAIHGNNSIRHEKDPGAPYPVPVTARPRPDGFVRVEDCW